LFKRHNLTCVAFTEDIMISLEILIAQVLFRERIVKLICLLFDD